MGVDMWAAVGRIKPVKRDHGMQHPIFGNRILAYEDFELYSGDETNLPRNRCLFDWLGDNFPQLETLPDLELKQKQTQMLIKWLNEEYAKPEAKTFPNDFTDEAPVLIGNDDIFDPVHFLGDRCHTLHFIKDLVEFDYDQLAKSEIQRLSCMTYREIFTEWDGTWFEFLDWAVKEKWEFAIFGWIY